MMELPLKIVVKTLFGFEPLLEKELMDLGAEQVLPGNRMVQCEGDWALVYKINLRSRVAVKVLITLGSFEASSEQMLYQGMQTWDWANFMRLDQTFSVDTRVDSPHFRHSRYVALKAKDAIVDQWRERTGERPSVDPREAQVPLHLHVQNRTVTVLLDSSGAPLHHRNYRKATNAAPMSEVLAAGLLLLSGWEGQSDFLDPMCGSGTLAIEAAFIACNRAPNGLRERFAFQHWPSYSPALWEAVRAEAQALERPFDFRIRASDKAQSAVDKTRENVAHAGMEDLIRVKREDFFGSSKHSKGFLHLVTNPPYDERLSIDSRTFFRELGDTLKHGYPDTDAWLMLGNLEALKFVGLRPSRKIKVFNGPIEGRLAKYSMYPFKPSEEA
jgi:putative N6-adenine-specific DNA methylase